MWDSLGVPGKEGGGGGGPLRLTPHTSIHHTRITHKHRSARTRVHTHTCTRTHTQAHTGTHSPGPRPGPLHTETPLSWGDT